MNFYMPTRIIIEKDCVVNSGNLIKNYGCKALIVTGSSSAKKSGALDDVITSLENVCCEYKIYDKIVQNPTIESCIEGGNIAKNFGADYIIGIGGGSPLDAAKAIAVFAANDINEKQFYGLEWNKALPVIAVGTTAGTGSEVTQVAVITNSDGMKKSIRHDLCYPVIALGDSRYTNSLSENFTISTAADALAHCIESYFNETATEFSKVFAIRGCNLLTEAFADLFEKGNTDRDKFYTASIYGGLAISVTGTNFPHAMSYFLSENHSVPHGDACAFYLPEFLNYNEIHAKDLYNEFFNNLNTSPEVFKALLTKLSQNVKVTLTNKQKAELDPRWENNSCLKKCIGGITPEFLSQMINKLF